MVEIYPRIFCGSDADAYALLVTDNLDEWTVLHCAKEKWHREMVGYTGRGAPKEHPEYLFARRGNRMALNMVDAPKPEFFSPEMIKAGLDFLEEGFKAGKNLLVHCNQGESRGPSVVMLYVYKYHVDHAIGDSGPVSFEAAEAEMRRIYPAYNPGEGIRAHLMRYWGEY